MDHFKKFTFKLTLMVVVIFLGDKCDQMTSICLVGVKDSDELLWPMSRFGI